jgi:cytochrome c peroxidase
MSDAKVELGCHLFYDRRLSFNQKQSCASCHQQSLAFTDGRARAVGSTGEVHPRSSMTLVNVAYLPALTWANPTLTQLEAQALIPMFGDRPVELGMKGREDLLLARVKNVPEYQRLFPAAFPGEKDPFEDLIEFFKSLTDTSVPTDPRFSDPWKK